MLQQSTDQAKCCTCHLCTHSWRLHLAAAAAAAAVVAAAAAVVARTAQAAAAAEAAAARAFAAVDPAERPGVKAQQL